jgi:hypothetical protein
LFSAGVIIDPFDWAKDDVVGSRDFIAQAGADLTQHASWQKAHLEAARISREQYFQRQKLRSAEYRRRVRRQRLLRACRRIAAAAAFVVAAASVLLFRRTAMALAFVRDQVVAAITWSGHTLRAAAQAISCAAAVSYTWLGPRARTGAKALLRALSASAAWGGAEARALGRLLYEAAKAAAFSCARGIRSTFLRTVAAGSACGRVLYLAGTAAASSTARATRAGLAWSGAAGATFGRASLESAAISASWVKTSSKALARVLSVAASAAAAWLGKATRITASTLSSALSDGIAWAGEHATGRMASATVLWLGTACRACASATVKAVSASSAWLVHGALAFARNAEAFAQFVGREAPALGRALLTAAKINLASLRATARDAVLSLQALMEIAAATARVFQTGPPSPPIARCTRDADSFGGDLSLSLQARGLHSLRCWPAFARCRRGLRTCGEGGSPPHLSASRSGDEAPRSFRSSGIAANCPRF